MSSIAAPLLAFACALALTGCDTPERGSSAGAGPAEAGDGGDQAQPSALSGKLWTLVALNGAEVAAERPPTLQLEQGRASAFGGVNRLSASYSAQGNEVTFGAIASTRMAGDPALMELEGAFAAALARADAFQVAGNELRLSSQGALVAIFRGEP